MVTAVADDPKFVVYANGVDGWLPVCNLLAPDGEETDDPELAVIAIVQLPSGMFTGAAVDPECLVPWAKRNDPDTFPDDQRRKN